jgi:hypothetical protein
VWLGDRHQGIKTNDAGKQTELQGGHQRALAPRGVTLTQLVAACGALPRKCLFIYLFIYLFSEKACRVSQTAALLSGAAGYPAGARPSKCIIIIIGPLTPAHDSRRARFLRSTTGEQE